MESEREGEREDGSRKRREGVVICKRIEEERCEGGEFALDEDRRGKLNNNHGLRTKVKVPSEKRSRDNVRGSKGKEKPGLVKVSSEKSLKLTVGQSQRPPRRSLVVTKKEGKEVESLRSERRKAKEEKEKSLRKEKSPTNIQENGKQEQIVEKSLHASKKSPKKNRRKVSNLDLQKVKEAEESSALAAKKLEVVQPAQPLLHLPHVGPPLHLPLGQSLATLHLNLAELAHIRKQVGFKCFHFMSLFLLIQESSAWLEERKLSASVKTDLKSGNLCFVCTGLHQHHHHHP